MTRQLALSRRHQPQHFGLFSERFGGNGRNTQRLTHPSPRLRHSLSSGRLIRPLTNKRCRATARADARSLQLRTRLLQIQFKHIVIVADAFYHDTMAVAPLACPKQLGAA